MKKIFIAIIIFTNLGIGLFAQSTVTPTEKKSMNELRGDKYAFVYSFDKAIVSYTKTKKLTMDGQRSLALSYHNLDQNVRSEEAYAKLLSAPTGIVPQDHYNYAMVLKANGKYPEANNSMEKFNALNPASLSGKSYSVCNNNLSYLLSDDGKYKVGHLKVNTDATDFGTCFYKDKVIFSSSRTKLRSNEKNYNWNGKPFLDLYVSDIDSSQLKTPELFDKCFRGKMHDGTASFNKDGTFMAFSCNNHSDSKTDKVVELEICFSSFKDGKWSKPIPFSLNDKNYGVGQPFLTNDGNTMYFTSDMPGGFGGSDIYKVSKNDTGAWKKAENLGSKINTEGNEMFPFFEENNRILLFTSDGHFGLGGMDIFMCAMNNDKFGKVYNAGVPLNSQSDDFAAIVNAKTNKGYFSSNRVEGSGSDDIYSVDFLKGLNAGKKIIGIAKDKDGIPIPQAFIKLLDDKGNVIDTITTKDDAAYSFLVDSDKNFKLIGIKKKYNDGDAPVNTYGIEFVVKSDVVLLVPPKKEEIIAKKIIVGADLGKILELKPIYFDLNKFKIRQDAAIELDKIIKIMNEYPTMIVELGSHTDCRNTKLYNQKLSEKRAKASAEYIKQKIHKPERVYGKGYGETKLINGCACEGKVISKCSEKDHQDNRRTEFIIVKK